MQEFRKSIDVGGIETAYYERGSGPILVLFHGGNFGSGELADSALDWSLTFDALAERCHVFAIDKIGQGYSDCPKSDEDYTMAATVRHACKTMDELGLKNVHVAGHSRGGYLVCRMTQKRPDLVATCTIIDSNSGAPGIGLNEIVLANPPGEPRSAETQRWIAEHYSYSPAHVSDDWINAMVEIAERPAYIEAWTKMAVEGLRTTRFMPGLARDKMDMFAWLRDTGINRPTQLIWGYNDPTAPVDMGRALFDLIAARERRAQFSVINEAGHFSYREHPRAFNALLHAFIEGVSGTD